MGVRYRIALSLFCVGALSIAEPVFGEERFYQQARVVEPFLEIHTGPGGSYPVFYIAEKGEFLSLLKERTGWFKVRLVNGNEGWVHRLEIEKTLRSFGHQKRFTERIYDDFIADRVEMGWGGGTFGGDPTLYVRATYLSTEIVALEGSVGLSSGDLGGTELYNGGLVIIAWKNRWVSLFGTLGGGAIHVVPTSLLVDATTGTFPVAYAGVGMTTPFFRNLFIRSDFRNFTLFVNPKQTQEFQEYSIGLSFRF